MILLVTIRIKGSTVSVSTVISFSSFTIVEKPGENDVLKQILERAGIEN
jgi:hypothetical protein